METHIYKKMTIAEKAAQLNSEIQLEEKDIEAVWDAMAEQEEKVELSKNYGEIINIRDRDVLGVRVLTHVGETIKFKHIYSLVE